MTRPPTSGTAKPDSPLGVPAPCYVTGLAQDGPDFSICALVRNPEKYDRLLASFSRNDFDARNSEFLVADNRDANRFDGYSWQEPLLARAKGRFVIFCHDDIELLDQDRSALISALERLERDAPDWLLAGVAGGRYRPRKNNRPYLRMHISDPWGENRQMGEIPGRVETLDECFILMRRSRPVLPSLDLSGFHFYGADLCLQAELQGGSAWAIDFHIRHHGRGTKDATFAQCRDRFVAKYARIFPGRTLHCTTGLVTFPTEDPQDAETP